MNTQERIKRRMAVHPRKEDYRLMSLEDRLKSLSVARESVGELMELHSQAAQLAGSYAHFTMDLPEWLTAAQKQLNSEINLRNRDELERKLAQARARVDKFASREEKSDKAKAELAALEALAQK